MPYSLPPDADEVVDFFMDNSSELERVKHVMLAQREEERRQQLERLQKTQTKMVPCNTYGCTDPKPEGSIFCAGCYQDYKEDPDAYK